MSFITSDGYELYVETNDAKDKPVIMFVSGYMGIADIWRQLSATLGNQYYCIAHDNRGYGRSSKPDDPSEYSIEKNAQDISSIMNALHIYKPMLLVTHSFGSHIASSFFLQAPECVAGIVYTGSSFVENPGVDPDTFFRTVSDNCHVPSKVVEFYTKLGLREDIAMEAAKWSPQAREKFARHGVYFKMGKKWQDITVPTMVVHGNRDVVCSVDGYAARFAAALPNSRLEVLEGVNHFPPTEAPKEVAKLIKKFVSSIALEGHLA